MLIVFGAIVGSCSLVFNGNSSLVYARAPVQVIMPDAGGGNVVYSFSGEGTEDEPYIISTSTDIAHLSSNVSNGYTYEGNYFKMTSSIDMSSVSITPIGVSYAFKGIFDGGWHAINNYSYTTTSSSYAGLFGRVVGAEIKNLIVRGTVTNATSSAGRSSGIVAEATNSTLSNLVNFCTVTCKNGSTYAGGVVAFASDTTIDKCTNYGEINIINADVENYYYAGGIVGRYSTERTPISICNNLGNVNCGTSGTCEKTYYAGGICGYCYINNQTTNSITRSSNQGDILAGNTNASKAYSGGICGGGSVGKINYCFNRGKITSEAKVNETIQSVEDMFNNTYIAFHSYSYCSASMFKTTSEIYAYACGITNGAVSTSNCYNFGSVCGGYKMIEWFVHIYVQRRLSLIYSGGGKFLTITLTYTYHNKLWPISDGTNYSCYYTPLSEKNTYKYKVNDDIGDIKYSEKLEYINKFTLGDKSSDNCYQFEIFKGAQSTAIYLYVKWVKSYDVDAKNDTVYVLSGIYNSKYYISDEAKALLEEKSYIPLVTRTANDSNAANYTIGPYGSSSIWGLDEYINNRYSFIADMYW